MGEGKTLREVGEVYSVSRQRLYQVCTKYGISTKERERKNFLRGKPPKYYWLNNILTHKGFSKKERLELLESLPLPDVCPVLGIILNYDGTGIEAGYSARHNSPSVDQIAAAGGYTKDNIAIISWQANRLKNNGTAEEHFAIAVWMKKEISRISENKACNMNQVVLR